MSSRIAYFINLYPKVSHSFIRQEFLAQKWQGLEVRRIALCGSLSMCENWWRALFLVLGKFPEVTGQIKCMYHRYVGAKSGLIEYK